MSPWTPERWRARPLWLQAEGAWDGARAWPSFEAWCAAHPGARCAGWVSSALLTEMVAGPAERLADDEAVLAWARALLQRYHGDAALAWPLAAWRQGRQRGASALRLPLERWQRAAAAQRVRLAALRPWWSAVLPMALRARPALRRGEAELLLVEGTAVTAIALRDGRLQGLEIRRLDAAHAGSLQAWCAEREARPRVVAGHGLAGPWPAGWDVLGDLSAPGPAWGGRGAGG